VRSRTESILHHAPWLLLACAACGADRGSAQSAITITMSPTAKSAGEDRQAPPGSVLPAPPDSVAPATTERENAKSAHQRRCVADADCSRGFCDRGVCGEVEENPSKGAYGRECVPPPPEPSFPPGMYNGLPSTFVDMCGPYRCLDGRCRSCPSDADCGGGMTCRHVEGRPGKTCGDYSHRRERTVAQPPPPICEPGLLCTDDGKDCLAPVQPPGVQPPPEYHPRQCPPPPTRP
jgi:hypothetical protein